MTHERTSKGIYLLKKCKTRGFVRVAVLRCVVSLWCETTRRVCLTQTSRKNAFVAFLLRANRRFDANDIERHADYGVSRRKQLITVFVVANAQKQGV